MKLTMILLILGLVLIGGVLRLDVVHTRQMIFLILRILVIVKQNVILLVLLLINIIVVDIIMLKMKMGYGKKTELFV